MNQPENNIIIQNQTPWSKCLKVLKRERQIITVMKISYVPLNTSPTSQPGLLKTDGKKHMT
jgi:hypothetical protein